MIAPPVVQQFLRNYAYIIRGAKTSHAQLTLDRQVAVRNSPSLQGGEFDIFHDDLLLDALRNYGWWLHTRGLTHIDLTIEIGNRAQPVTLVEVFTIEAEEP